MSILPDNPSQLLQIFAGIHVFVQHLRSLDLSQTQRGLKKLI